MKTVRNVRLTPFVTQPVAFVANRKGVVARTKGLPLVRVTQTEIGFLAEVDDLKMVAAKPQQAFAAAVAAKWSQVQPKAVPEVEVRPVKMTLNRKELAEHVSRLTHLPKTEVEHVLAGLTATIQGSLCKSGGGEFVLPGVVKLMTKAVAARRGGKKVLNRFTGEMQVQKARPAGVRIKARAVSALKKSVF